MKKKLGAKEVRKNNAKTPSMKEVAMDKLKNPMKPGASRGKKK